MRSLIIADEVARHWPEAEICFILSKEAPYAATCPYPVRLLERTPTKEVKAVNALMDAYRPDIVLFDASGRKSQLEYAHALGAKVVFFSQHRRKRSRGMKIGRARVTDAHLVVQPEFVIGPVSGVDTLKMKLIGKPLPHCIGPVFSAPNVTRQQGLLMEHGIAEGEFVLFNAGSGGHKLAGMLAADSFFEAAKLSYKSSGMISVMVFGPNYPKELPVAEGVMSVSTLSNNDFINLLVAARAAVLSGGDTLLQAIALKKLVLATPVSKDQPARIASCVARGLILDCKLTELSEKVSSIFATDVTASIERALADEAEMDGLQLTMKCIKGLLDAHHSLTLK